MFAPNLHVLFTLAAMLLGNVAAATPQNFVIDPAHTYATFEVSHLGVSTQRGGLGSAVGTAVLDEMQGTGEMTVTLDAHSLSTGSGSMEKLLRSSSWFAVEEHPAVTFRATSISFLAQKPIRVDGALTLRGVTRPLSLTVTHYACTRLPFGVRLTCGMDAQGWIKRSDFGMDSLLAFVGDEVKLLIQAEAMQQEPTPVELRP